MATRQATHGGILAGDQEKSPLLLEAESFHRHLRARNASPKTIEAYKGATDQLDSFLAASGMPRDPEHIAREHLEAFMESLLTRWKPATASNRYRALQAFFKYLVETAEPPAPLAHGADEAAHCAGRAAAGPDRR